MTTLSLSPVQPRPGRRIWLRQTLAAADLELRRLRGRGGLPLFLLALSPLSIFGAWAIFGAEPAAEVSASGQASVLYAGLFHAFLLRLIVFFGCVAVFSNAFRREIMDQTLHYSLLAPIRREALVLGKYLAGVAAAGGAFAAMVVASLVLFYLPFDAAAVGSQAVRDGLAYLLVTEMAVVGYGALFLTLGILVRNPIVPAVIVFAWDSVSFILPPLLQRTSVIYYLEQLSPVPIPDSPFAIPAAPVPGYLAVGGLLAVSAALLAVAAAAVRRFEINYGAD